MICGDLFQSKNNISPILYTFTSAFLRQLEEITRVYVISGNHDLLENNLSKKDAISALFETAAFSNTFLLDKELEYRSGCIIDDNVTWALYSIYDGYVTPHDLTSNKVNYNDIGRT